VGPLKMNDARGDADERGLGCRLDGAGVARVTTPSAARWLSDPEQKVVPQLRCQTHWLGAQIDRSRARRCRVAGDAIRDEINQPSQPRLFQVLGPGLVTGAADDDPSGIATYSQVGAQFGYGLAWTLVFSYPLMAAIQEISARIGRVTGRGIAGNLRRYYSAWLSGIIVLLLLVANLINLGADLGAMGAALKLMVGGPALVYVVLFALLSSGLQIFTRYERYQSSNGDASRCLLTWSALSLSVCRGTRWAGPLSGRRYRSGRII
jgi:hypothetical protein